MMIFYIYMDLIGLCGRGTSMVLFKMSNKA